MRNTKRISVGEKEVMVKELTLAEILGFLDGPETDEKGLEGMITNALEMFVEGMTFEDLKSLAPSEIEGIVEAAKEVNAPLLRILKFLQLDQALDKILDMAKKEFYGVFAGLSKTGTLTPGSMDSASS